METDMAKTRSTIDNIISPDQSKIASCWINYQNSEEDCEVQVTFALPFDRSLNIAQTYLFHCLLPKLIIAEVFFALTKESFAPPNERDMMPLSDGMMY